MFINSEISTRSVPRDLVKAHILSKWRTLLSPQQVTLWPFLDDSWPLSPKDELPVLEYKCNKNMGPIRLSLSKVLLRFNHVVYAYEYEQSTVYLLLETWAFSALGYYK